MWPLFVCGLMPNISEYANWVSVLPRVILKTVCHDYFEREIGCGLDLQCNGTTLINVSSVDISLEQKQTRPWPLRCWIPDRK